MNYMSILTFYKIYLICASLVAFPLLLGTYIVEHYDICENYDYL